MDGNTEVERGTRRWLGDSKRGARKSTVNLAGRRWHTRAVLRMVNGNVRKATMRQTGESEREHDNNRERAIERKREAESTSESERELEPEIEDLGGRSLTRRAPIVLLGRRGALWPAAVRIKAAQARAMRIPPVTPAARAPRAPRQRTF